MNSKIWIKTSVFYEKSLWNRLLSECLKPFLVENKIYIDKFYLALNTDQGDNIRLALLCDLSKREFILNHFLNLVESYLRMKPSVKASDENIGNSFFMDFQNNSIHFNLYDLNKNPAIREFQLALSEKVINFFSVERYNNSSAFNFAFQILVLIDTLYSLNDRDKKAIMNNVTYKKYVHSHFDYCYDFYLKNRHEITLWKKEILKDNTLKLIHQCYSKILASNKTLVYAEETKGFILDKLVINQISISTESLGKFYTIFSFLS